MIVGVGVDLLHRDRLAPAYLDDASAFVRRTFTGAERSEARRRPRPADYFAARFCAKEAVFKCLGADPQHARLSEIEIITASTGQPRVRLHGALAAQATRCGITEVLISLTSETSHFLAFAVAEGPGQERNH